MGRAGPRVGTRTRLRPRGPTGQGALFGLGRYVVAKLAYAVPILWAAVTLVFFAMRLIPGDPTDVVLGEYATPTARQALQAQMGLDEPLLAQYGKYLGGLLRGDVGRSLITNRPILADLRRELPYTVDLTLASTLISMIIGIPIGVMSALRRNSAVDYAFRTFALLGLSAPPFYLAIVLLLLFAVVWPWFPVMGGGDMASILDRLYHLVLPAFSLGLINAALVTRMTRASVLEVLGDDYIRTAHSKGLGPARVIYRHALRNALIPIITVVGLNMGVVIGGAVLTEIVFSRPGIGKMLVDAILKRDYPVVQTSIIVIAALVTVVNLVVDLLYGFLDPRIRYE